MVAQRQAARAPKTQAKAESPPREPAREPAREKIVTGWVDENGEPLRRKNPTFRNADDFAPSEIPEGMAYQWIRIAVFGDPSESELSDMMENAWRPVPWERHKNRFAPSFLSRADEANNKGCIMRKGQLLVERPIYLNKEAEADRQRDVDMQINSVFQSKGVPLPDNVQQMGLQSRQGIARRNDRPTRFMPRGNDTDFDAMDVPRDMMPKREIELDR